MNLRNTFNRSFRLSVIFAAITLLGSIFWYAGELYSTEYQENTLPEALVSETAPVSSLPAGIAEDEAQSAQSRELYAALNDTIYSDFINYETSRATVAVQPKKNMTAGNSPEFLTAKAQCNVRGHATTLEKLDGAALSNKECL